MTLHQKNMKTLILILLLGGELGHSPASFEACLPYVPPLCDQANILFAPVSFCLLDFRHPYSATATIIAALVTVLAGLMLPILISAVMELIGQFKKILKYVQVKSLTQWINTVCISSLTSRLVSIHVATFARMTSVVVI